MKNTRLVAAQEALRKVDRQTLEEVAHAYLQGQLALQRLACPEAEPRALEVMPRARVHAASTEALIQVLAPFAALGQLAHEHHPEHEATHAPAR